MLIILGLQILQELLQRITLVARNGCLRKRNQKIVFVGGGPCQRLDSHNEGADEDRLRECTVSCAHLRLFFGKLRVEICALHFRLRTSDVVRTR